MLGLMQDWPLTVDRIIERAARFAEDSEVVSRRCDGTLARTTYAALHDRARQVSAALRAMGIGNGDRVATLSMNSAEHLEAWYGTMGIGAVLHTLNPRLHPDQIAWIANHASDRVLILDAPFVPIVQQVHDRMPVEHYIVISDDGIVPDNSFGAIAYEDWIAGRGTDAAWGGFDENTACGLCYTSGTTGNPKGVLYSHRSNVLHAMMAVTKDALGVGYQDTVMPVVPMFHANAWALAFAAPMMGARMVLPGFGLDGASLYALFDGERVTISAAVPTLWLGLMDYLKAGNLKLPHLQFVAIGGAALPERVLRAFETEYDVRIGHAWGMTEMSPIGTVCRVPRELADGPFDDQLPHKLRQGVPPFSVEIRTVDDKGDEQVWGEGKSGHLQVRGVAVSKGYFGGEGGDILDSEGWFDTGDLAEIDKHGSVKLTDRAKDVIKSGGEWISSIDLENALLSHPDVANAAAIAMPDPKWGERPMMIVQAEPGASPDADGLRAFLDGRIAKWWMPDEFVFVDAIPLGATGKVNKRALRELYVTQAPASN
ncbi:long-chain-fatty-acid--CoA ligase [Croceicoccus bisphenolivorans]|uniref:long-chain-fatty-acid--CoA ligase n=1 Tax=Croceicoccus bisphenolivorans TaxID=1783232 RepID=UPI0008334BC2|nr:long-chain-fatty-acid--CoA ligase [Croceicoccus bisphenolivorans]